MNEVGYTNPSDTDTAERRTVLFAVPTSCELREQEKGRKLECTKALSYPHIVGVQLDRAMSVKLKQIQGFKNGRQSPRDGQCK